MAADFMCGSGAGWLAPWLGSALRDPPPPSHCHHTTTSSQGKEKKKKKKLFLLENTAGPLLCNKK